MELKKKDQIQWACGILRPAAEEGDQKEALEKDKLTQILTVSTCLSPRPPFGHLFRGGLFRGCNLQLELSGVRAVAPKHMLSSVA